MVKSIAGNKNTVIVAACARNRMVSQTTPMKYMRVRKGGLVVTGDTDKPCAWSITSPTKAVVRSQKMIPVWLKRRDIQRWVLEVHCVLCVVCESYRIRSWKERTECSEKWGPGKGNSFEPRVNKSIRVIIVAPTSRSITVTFHTSANWNLIDRKMKVYQ